MATQHAPQDKKHNTAITSRMSWKEVLKSGLIVKEKNLTLKYLKDQTKPKTSRQIANDLHKERTNITRTLHDLVKDELIVIEKIAKCKTTGKLVQHYSILTDKTEA